MAATRNRLKQEKCEPCQGTGENGAMSICPSCDGTGVSPTVEQLRRQLSSAEADASLQRERDGKLSDSTSTRLGVLHTQLRLAERRDRGGK